MELYKCRDIVSKEFVLMRECPICKSKEIYIQTSCFVWWVHCLSCGMYSGNYPTREALVEAWNKR
ncbi:MAG: Lar family restriction alleviation protein [Bacteroidaceae bacterium]|nr:Lar family restriction alleviation protein [Bacteroidaceae bacterium]